MDVVLIFFAALATAFLCARLAEGSRLMLVDLLFGICGGLAGLGLANVLAAEGVVAGRALPLLFACTLTLGLESLRRRPVRW